MERKNIFNGFRSQSLSSLTKIIVIIIIIVVAKQIQEDERLKMLTMMVRSAIVTWLQSLPLLICQSAGGEIERESKRSSSASAINSSTCTLFLSLSLMVD